MSGAAPAGLTLSASPSPYQAPSLWNKVTFALPVGEVSLPGLAGEGKVEVSVEPGAKVKQKQASGSGTGQTSQQRAQKSETTVEAIEPAKISIEVVWTHRSHVETERALFLLNPNGPNGGQPFDIRHPETDANAISHVIIEKFGKKKRDGGLYSMTIEALEWNPPPPPAPGDGADTPVWNAQIGGYVTRRDMANVAAVADTIFFINEGLAKAGFGGPNAPKAKP